MTELGFLYYELTWLIIGLMFVGMIYWLCFKGINTYRFNRFTKSLFKKLPEPYGGTLFRIYGTINYGNKLPKLNGYLYVVKEPEEFLLKEIFIRKGQFFDSELLMNFPGDISKSEDRVDAVSRLCLYFVNFPTLRKPKINVREIRIVSVVEDTMPFSFSMTLD